MLRKLFLVVALAAFAASLGGCATFGKKKDLEIQDLKGQVQTLEVQLQNKDREIAGLREDLDRAMQERVVPVVKQTSIEPKSRPNARQIQVALLNAGYNPGKIDGRIGKQTREAIKSFQEANNLVADGKVGKKTWELLRGYLKKKTK